MSGARTNLTPVPGDPMPSSAFCGHLRVDMWTYRNRKTFLDRNSLCSLGWHGTHYVERAGDPPVSVFHVMGLKAHSTTPGPWFKNNNKIDLYPIETQYLHTTHSAQEVET